MNLPQLCIQCGKKPQYGGHQFCGRTCAREYKNSYVPTPQLCIQCGKKPQYGGHQFCGRTCAREYKNSYAPTRPRPHPLFQTHTAVQGQVICSTPDCTNACYYDGARLHNKCRRSCGK
jgi:hypothetical protein